MNLYYPVYNVYFLGGATYIKDSFTEQQKQIFSRCVGGKIRNVHTKNDTTLSIFQKLYGQEPIGRKMIYFEDVHNIDGKEIH